MSAEDVEFLRRMFEELGGTVSPRQPAETEPWWHEDIEYVEDPKWPGSDTYRGREEVLRVWNGYLEVLTDIRMQIEEVIDAGDEVLAIVRISGISKGAEVPFDRVWAYVCRIRDGKVAYWRAYVDPDEGLAAANVSP